MPEQQSLDTGSTSTSTSLLDLVRASDAEAWRQITEIYGPMIYAWCRKANLSPHDSADIIQDVFRSVVLHVSTFEKAPGSGSFRGWLWTITQNKVRDYFKIRAGKAHAIGGSSAQQRLAHIVDQPPSSLSDSMVPATNGLVNRVFNVIRREVQEATWQAFWRTTIDDIPPDVVAAELGISVQSVWQAKSRILRRARQLLAE